MNTEKLKTFLKASGAEILEPTNQYEVVRFKTMNGVSVIYTGKRGYSFTGEAKEAVEAMKKKNTWTIESNGMKKKKKAIAAIIERDGQNCFYCSCKLHKPNSGLLPTMTIEHLLSVADGGNNNVSNLVLACKPCNTAVADSPIIEKVKYREAMNHE